MSSDSLFASTMETSLHASTIISIAPPFTQQASHLSTDLNKFESLPPLDTVNPHQRHASVNHSPGGAGGGYMLSTLEALNRGS